MSRGFSRALDETRLLPVPTAQAAATPAPAPANWSAITLTSSGGTYRQRRPGANCCSQLAAPAGEYGARAHSPAGSDLACLGRRYER